MEPFLFTIKVKKNTLYEIVLKIFGIYFILLIVNNIARVLTSLSYFFNDLEHSSNAFSVSVFFMLFLAIVPVLLLLYLIKLLLFKTNKVISLISVEEGDEIVFQGEYDKEIIIETLLVLSGIITILWSLPEFLLDLNLYFSAFVNIFFTEEFDFGFVTLTLMRFIIGVFTIKFSKQIAKYLTKSPNR